MPTLHDSTFRDIGALMHGAVGLAFSDAKKPLIASRLAPRMHRLGLDSFEDYLALIADDGEGEEMQVAIDLLTTNETYFFRETKHYELLEQEILTRPRERWSMWSAACSFGDEAYSIAMLMTELQSARRIGGDWQILGTDISDRVLRSATEAVYPEDRLRELSPERLKRHCLRGEGDSQGLVMMKDTLRQHVKFGQRSRGRVRISCSSNS